MSNSEIFQLPSEISDKIAAGEVVERPYNVVKELIENAVDAGADKITIEINEGGLSLIKVADNGKGILPEDLPKTIERYATSKIRSFEDIYSVKTFGFRGEALAAISSVCDFTITSKREPFEGYALYKPFNSNALIKPAPANRGTTVEVANLFAKLPVRKKFLKNAPSEFKEILKFLKQFACINYHIYLILIKDGEKILELPKATSMLERIRSVYNESDCIEFENTRNHLSIHAVIGRPDNQKFRKDYITIAVNNRVIKDYQILQAVIQAYYRLMPENRFPLAFVNLKIENSDLDVNVHPTKTLVRFFNPNAVFSFVYESIKHRLNNLTLNAIINEPVYSPIKTSPDFNKFDSKFITYDLTNVLQTQTHTSISDNKTSFNNDDFNIIGQIFKTVIICEKSNELYLIDQHIAHERVLYEQYISSNSNIASIVLYEPILLETDQIETDILSQHQETLKKYGFEYEFFGKNIIKILSIPASLMKRNIEEELRGLLAELIENRNISNDFLAITMACRNAIKSGDYLTRFEMEEIVRNLFNTSNPFTCPHGRPIIFKMSKDFIYNKFQR